MTSVNLNKAEEKALSYVSSSERSKARERMLTDKQQKAKVKREAFGALVEKWSSYKNAPLEFAVTEAGYLVIKHTGTRRDAVLSPEKARTLVKNFRELEELVESLPETARPIGDKE